MTTTHPSVNQALYARARANARTRVNLANMARYEVEKRTWACLHPNATSHEYEHAVRAIANACGV